MLVQGSSKPATATAAPQTDTGIDGMDVDPPKETADASVDDVGLSNANTEPCASAPDGGNGAAPVPDSGAAVPKVSFCTTAHALLMTDM